MPKQTDLPDVGSLTRAIRAGDADAFAVLYRARFDVVYSVIRRYTRVPESDCLDITQEAFSRMIRAVPETDSENRLLVWMVIVARNTAFDFLKSERRRLQRHKRRPPAHEQRNAEIDDRLDFIRRVLDEESWSLLRLRFIEGRTLQTIATTLGLKPGALDGRIRRALRDARKALPDD